MVEQALVTEVVELLGEGWDFAVLWASLVGDEGSAGIQVRLQDGSVRNDRPSEMLLGLLSEHKRAAYEADDGTWLSLQISIAGRDRYETRCSNFELLDWVPVPVAEEFKRELAVHPRADDEVPGWMRQLLGSGEQ
ncbi:hypothetical protein [Nocardia sp. AG03]|uniref:hypothetical protein n=1 Tax=Nocardia sp. AG03 TaxID=3025312 RepID=UPI0024183991|nr:hypothetical protein [Nocardia sp. AG03]